MSVAHVHSHPEPCLTLTAAPSELGRFSRSANCARRTHVRKTKWRDREKGAVLHLSVTASLNKSTNHFEDSLKVVHNHLVLKANHLQSSSLEIKCPHGIIGLSVWGVMNTAVKLDHKFRLGAVKISDVTPEGFLPQKAHALKLGATQLLPQNRLGRRWILAIPFLQLEYVRSSLHFYNCISTNQPSTSKLPLSRGRERGSGGKSS